MSTASTCAQTRTSSLRSARDEVARALRGAQRAVGRRVGGRARARQLGRVADRPLRQVGRDRVDEPAGGVGVVERDRAAHAGAAHRHAARARRASARAACDGGRREVRERADEHDRRLGLRLQHGARAVRRRQHEHVAERLAGVELARRVAEVEALDAHALALAGEDRRRRRSRRPRRARPRRCRSRSPRA